MSKSNNLKNSEVALVPPNISVTLFHNTRLNKCYHYREPIQITNGETYTFVTHKDCLKLEWEVTSDTTNTPITVQTAPYSGYHFPADFETLVIVLVTDSAGVTNHFTFKVKVVKDPSSKD